MTMKKERYPLLSNESYKGAGESTYRVCLIIRQPQLEEAEQPHAFQVHHDQVIVKDQTYSFDRVVLNKNSNEEIYKCVLRNMVSHFLSGQSHMIQVMGERHTGKATLSIGNMRNPGLALSILQDVFNFIDEKFLQNNITIKLSVYEFDEALGFRDLLVQEQHSFMPFYCNQSNQILGIPEVIVDNYLLAMKILRLAMVNMINKEQNIASQKFAERQKNTNLIIDIKAEISPTDDLKEQVIISKLRLVKYSGSFQHGNVFKVMSDLASKRRKHIEVPFKSNDLLDYFRDTLLNTPQTILMCVNWGSTEGIKQASLMKEIKHKAAFTTFSIYQQNNQLKDIMSNQKESLNLFYKEFCQFSETKKERGRVIFSILLQVSSLFKQLLSLLDQASELKYKLNCLYSQMISFHCSKYQNIINTEDSKEFYMAKIQLYAIEQVQMVQAQCQPVGIEILNELQQKILSMFQLKKELSKIPKLFQKNDLLSQFDVQRLTNTHSLVTKLIAIFDNRLGYQILSQIEPKYYQMFDHLISIADQYRVEAPQLAKQESVQSPAVLKPPLPKFFKPQLPIARDLPTRQRFTDVIQQLFHDENTKEYYSSAPLFCLTKPSDSGYLKADSPPIMRQTVQSDLFEKLQSRQTRHQKLNIKNVILEHQNERFFQSTGVAFLKNQYRQGQKRTASQVLPRLVSDVNQN